VFLLDLTLGGWVLLELGLRVRDLARHRGGSAQDRATRILIGVTLGAALALASVATSRAPSLRIPGPHRAVALIVMWLGLAIRVWAIGALGSAFRTTVEVDPGQTLVSNGPYVWVRHPSYTGLLLIVSGFGLAGGNWLAVVICVLVPLPALLRRVQVEEAELNRVLGDPYRAYQARTKRLIPGVW
jgi:protein-S-isoprenylcysteine O-methyltransferase Ste14